jgi:spore germination cell wall hydrolase CwlJ-like protein
MQMNEVDIQTAALCIWKEARNGGDVAMRAVLSVILNRAKASQDSVYAEVFKPFQFTSMSVHTDKEYLLRPEDDGTLDWQRWLDAKALALSASTGCLEDNTGGAVSYYAYSIPAPWWAAKMTFTVEIGGQRFFKKKAA